MRRFASNRIKITSTQQYQQHVVEFSDAGELLSHYPLTHELPMTEWIGGTIYFTTTPLSKEERLQHLQRASIIAEIGNTIVWNEQ